MIRWQQLGKQEEAYSFHDSRDHSLVHVAVTRLNRYLEGLAWPVTYVAITDELVRAVATQGGVEPAHLGRVDTKRLLIPGTMADMDDGTHVLVDGAHRFTLIAMLGAPSAPMRIAPSSVWRRFQIAVDPLFDGDFMRDRLKAGQLPLASVLSITSTAKERRK